MASCKTRRQKSINLTDVEWTLIDRLSERYNLSQTQVFSELLKIYGFWIQLSHEYSPAADLAGVYFDSLPEAMTKFEARNDEAADLEQLLKMYPDINELRTVPPMCPGNALEHVRASSTAYAKLVLSPDTKALIEASAGIFARQDVPEPDKEGIMAEMLRKYFESRDKDKL